jgi:hypothetical protein
MWVCVTPQIKVPAATLSTLASDYLLCIQDKVLQIPAKRKKAPEQSPRLLGSVWLSCILQGQSAFARHIFDVTAVQANVSQFAVGQLVQLFDSLGVRRVALTGQEPILNQTGETAYDVYGFDVQRWSMLHEFILQVPMRHFGLTRIICSCGPFSAEVFGAVGTRKHPRYALCEYRWKRC